MTRNAKLISMTYDFNFIECIHYFNLKQTLKEGVIDNFLETLRPFGPFGE